MKASVESEDNLKIIDFTITVNNISKTLIGTERKAEKCQTCH